MGALAAPGERRAPASGPSTLPATGPAATASAPAGDGSVSGKVVDSAGKPVGGASVSIFVMAERRPKTLASTRSDKDGSFKLEPVPPGENLRLWASFQMPNGPMLSGEVRDLKVQAGKNNDVGAVKIAPARM